jgi:hypothetical protein
MRKAFVYGATFGDHDETLNQFLFFVLTRSLGEFFEVVRFRQQISRHFFKAFG